MRKKIKEQLRRIEDAENIKILLAVESGSRAWGFASPDSDYDVRFVYIRSLEDYLRLDAIRDVIELPIDDVLDINGWDLQKTLRLLHKSNPTLFEWFSSPIVYKKTEFSDKFRDLMMHYFSPKKTLYHYVSMAEGNYADKLDNCRVKLENPIETMLGVPEEAVGMSEISREVMQQFENQTSVLLETRRTKMDYWLSYLAYFFDINFKVTYEIIPLL